MTGFLAAAGLLPPTLRAGAHALSEGDMRRCEELRLRAGRPASVLLGGRERDISRQAVTERDLRAVLEAATRSSLHAAVDALAQGYVTAGGGVRVGVCGTASDGAAMRSFSSLCLRVPRQVPGCADGIWERVTRGGFRSLLIISPPGAGKTTLLRELARRLSDAGTRVCLADERGEVAACGPDGAPVFDIGARTDVMTGVPKARAAGMLLRAMGPQVLAMDEITEEADALALLGAVGCGVRLLATVHGASPEEIAGREACRALFERGAFARCVTVEERGGVRSYTVRELP